MAFGVCVCVPAVHSGIPSDQSSGTSSPLCDSGLHLNYHPNNTVLFSLALTDCFYNCPSVTMQQRPWCQKVVSMQLSLLTDNRHALSLSFEVGESAFLCSSRSLSLPVHLQQQQQQDSCHVDCLDCARRETTSPSKLRFTLLQDTLSCSSWPTSPGLRWEKRWVDLRLIPLLHSKLSQYNPGSDVCR